MSREECSRLKRRVESLRHEILHCHVRKVVVLRLLVLFVVVVRLISRLNTAHEDRALACDATVDSDR